MKKKLVILSGMLMLFGSNLTAYASSDTGNAVADIMNDERFQGAMSTIDGLTGFIDHYMTMIITIIAFFIISSALLKNVCAAAYCANSKFWNKVDKAHQAADAASIASVLGGIKTLPKKSFGGDGGIGQMLLCIVPNIKAMTDFDDQEMEPKHYWMKAIPQMLACVIIGVFVYNGYYRDASSVVGAFGSEVISRALSSVDPEQMVDTLLLTSGTPKNIFDGDPTNLGKINHEVSMELYKTFRSAWELSSTEDKTELMRNAEAQASALTTMFVDEFTTDVGSNKIVKLSGLVITELGENSQAWGSEIPNKAGWYPNAGATYTGTAKNDCQVFQTADEGATRSFALYHQAPAASGNLGLHKESNWYKIMGTLTLVDGDDTNQLTGITGNTVMSSSLVINSNIPTQNVSAGNGGMYGSDAIYGSLIDSFSSFTLNGQDTYSDLNSFLYAVLNQHYNKEGTEGDNLSTVTIMTAERVLSGWANANKETIQLDSAHNVNITYKVTFTVKKGSNTKNATAEIVVPFHVNDAGASK